MKKVTGNLLDMAENGDFEVIIHGCNCFNTMGSGIAKQIKDRYPSAYKIDCMTEKGNLKKLGWYTSSLQTVNNTDFVIINAYTQYNFTGRKVGKIDVDYDAIRKVMRKINIVFKGCRIGYPMIGAGLAGGDWGIISKIIEEELINVDHTLVEFDQNI